MSNADWFARKMGNPVPVPVQPQQQPPQYVAPQPATYVAPSQPQYPPSQQMTPQAPRCPGCGSENYGSVQGTRARCYDCGYPIQQSGSGLGKGIVNPGASSAGPATPAKQIAHGTFNGSKPAIAADGSFL